MIHIKCTMNTVKDTGFGPIHFNKIAGKVVGNFM